VRRVLGQGGLEEPASAANAGCHRDRDRAVLARRDEPRRRCGGVAARVGGQRVEARRQSCRHVECRRRAVRGLFLEERGEQLLGLGGQRDPELGQ
jgi:hypothetical protein